MLNRINNNINMFTDYVVEKNYRVFVFLALIIFLLYFRTIWFDYTFLDDTELILKNHEVIKDWGNLGRVFTDGVFFSDEEQYYRPILSLSFMVDEKISGKELWGYHISNIIYHIITCFLLFIFLCLMKISSKTSFLLTILFAIHPVFNLAISWIPGRNDVLMSIFILLSLISFILYIKNSNKIFFILYCFLFFISLLTKESCLITIFIISLIYLLFYREYFLRFLTAFLVSVVIIYLYGRLRSVAINNEFNLDLIINYLKVVFDNKIALIQHLGNFFIPIRLSTIHTINDYPNIFGYFSIVLLFVIIYFNKINIKYILLGVSLYIGFFVPSLVNLISMEHRLYFPSIGLLILISGLLNKTKKLTIYVIFFFLLISLNIYYQNSFKNGFYFFKNARNTSPNHPLVQDYSGKYNMYIGNYDESIMYYEKAIELLKKNEYKYIDKEQFLLKENNRVLHVMLIADQWDELSVKIDSLLVKYEEVAFFHLLKGIHSIMQKDYKNAETSLGKSIYYDNKNIEALKFLIILNDKNGDIEKRDKLLIVYNNMNVSSLSYAELVNTKFYNKTILSYFN